MTWLIWSEKSSIQSGSSGPIFKHGLQFSEQKIRISITLRNSYKYASNSFEFSLTWRFLAYTICGHIFPITIVKASELCLSQLMRLWYLSHRRPAKAQASLRIRAFSPEPSLFANMKYGSRRRGRPKIRHLVPLDGCACTFEE